MQVAHAVPQSLPVTSVCVFILSEYFEENFIQDNYFLAANVFPVSPLNPKVDYFKLADYSHRIYSAY